VFLGGVTLGLFVFGEALRNGVGILERKPLSLKNVLVMKGE
jgi:hypothetical protein